MSHQISIEYYSERSFVIRGDFNKKYNDKFIAMHGKWNRSLKGGPGWIFSNRHLTKMNAFIEDINSEKKLPVVPNDSINSSFNEFKIQYERIFREKVKNEIKKEWIPKIKEIIRKESEYFREQIVCDMENIVIKKDVKKSWVMSFFISLVLLFFLLVGITIVYTKTHTFLIFLYTKTHTFLKENNELISMDNIQEWYKMRYSLYNRTMYYIRHII